MTVSNYGEFRQHAILLFADLCDFTGLNEASDPEDVALVLHGIRNRVEELIVQHGGSVNEWRGDGVLCTFGLPRASEDEARHAIEAALAIHAAVRGLERELPVPRGFEIRLHSGLHSGLVFASVREASQGYDLVGDAVNTAARLCERAGRDELWVSEATLEGVLELFETQPVEQLVLKGKRSVVPARRVLRRTDLPDRFAASQRRGLTPLVGRESALACMQTRLGLALDGHLSVISVVGSPGVGKTRVIEEFKQRALRRARIVTGRCENAANTKPLKPFSDALGEILGLRAQSTKAETALTLGARLTQIAPGLHEHENTLLHLLGLASLPPGTNDPELVQQSLVDALGVCFLGLCAERPLILILDDWQWADDASRQVLGSLMRVLRDSPALLVLGSREIADPLLVDQPFIELHPFSRDESAAVIAALLPVALDLGLKQAIHERSGGNPLFLEELCRALPTEVPTGAEDLAASRVPTTLRGIIQVRVERLPESAAHLLRAAAIIGNEVPIWLLKRVSGSETPALPCAELVRHDLIYETEGQRSFHFKHGTTRDVVYESVRLPERRRLHYLAANALESQAEAAGLALPYEALAYHCAGAGDQQQAARFAEIAGDQAAVSSSLDRARQQYRAAMDALEKLGLEEDEQEGRWIALVSKWAASSLYSPAHPHLEVIESARSRALRRGDLMAATRAEYWLGWFHYALGNQRPAIVHCRNALEKAAKLGDERLVGQLRLNLGQSLAAAGEYQEALEHLDAGLAVKREAGTLRSARLLPRRRTPLGFAYALACKGFLLGDLGEFPLAYQCFDEALLALEGTGHAVEGSCLGLLGMVQLLQGRWQDCLKTATRAQATAERVNGPYVFAMSKTVGGYARWMLERSADALAELLSAVSWMERRGVELYLSFNYGFLAEALVSAGETELARDYAERALARSKTDHLGEAAAYRTLGRLAAEWDTGKEEARAYLKKAMASATARKSAREIALTELELLRLRTLHSDGDAHDASGSDPQAAFRAMGMDFYERESVALLARTLRV